MVIDASDPPFVFIVTIVSSSYYLIHRNNLHVTHTDTAKFYLRWLKNNQ
jgi:hypothetical protein